MIDRPDTPHADVLLEGIWEDEVTPDDLASRALSAAQASSYAFRVASEGTTATAQLGEVDVSEFLESETGKWAQGFIGIVRVGESLVHVSHALGELARSLQQVNLEQSEIVYQVEAEIEAAERHSAQTGTDPASRVAELIATARARAVEVAEKMTTPETASAKEKPAAGLVSGFMAFGRVPGASAEASERNGRVARNGHARNGYAVRNTRAEQNGHEPVNGRSTNGHAGSNGHEAVDGRDAADGDVVMSPEAAAAAAQDAFANSVDEAPMDLAFLGFGRMPASSVPRAEDSAVEGVSDDDVPERADETPVEADDVEEDVIAEVETSEVSTNVAEDDAPVLADGFLGLGRAPSVSAPVDVATVPVVPQPLFNGFAFGRTPGAGERDAVSGPIPVAAPAGFVPIPVEDAPADDEQTVEESEAGTEIAIDSVVDGGPSFGRVPGGTWSSPGAVPTVPVEPAAVVISADERTDAAESLEPGPDRDLGGEAVDVDGDAGDPVDGPVVDEIDEDDDMVDIDDEDLSLEADFADDESDAEADDFGMDSVSDGVEQSDDAALDEPAFEAEAEADESDDESAAPAIAAGTAQADADEAADEIARVESIDEEPIDEEPTDGEPEDAVAEDVSDAPADRDTVVEPTDGASRTDQESETPAPQPTPAVPAPVKKSGVIKFSDLLKGQQSSAAPTAPTAGVAGAAEAASRTPSPPARTAPVLATGPAILGRTEPLVLPKRKSPEVQQVHDAAASILGSLSGGPHGPESGLHWAAGLLVTDEETVMAVTTSDAGWLPPGVVIPAGVRVLWNIPNGYRWASIDDPVRQLVDYAERNAFTLTAVATTHPSRAYSSVVGAENMVGVRRPGAVLPGGRSRFEAAVSPARLQQIRALNPEQARRQVRALIRDLETQPIAPEHAIGIEAARIDARCFLDEGTAVPPAVLEQLHSDERALADVLGLDRTPSAPEDLTAPAPDAARLRDRLMERAIVVATLAATYHDIESAVYAWTFARFLSSQDQD